MELLLWLLLVFGLPLIPYVVHCIKKHMELDIEIADAVIDEVISSDLVELLLKLEENFSRLDLKRVEWRILSIKVANGVKIGSRTDELIDEILLDAFPVLAQHLAA